MKEVASMFDVDPETVRRWIRSGKLQALQASKKTGNVITEDMLDSFVRSVPKYASSIRHRSTSSALTSLAVSAAALLGGVALGQFQKKEEIRNARMEASVLIGLLEQSRQENLSKINNLQEKNREIENKIRELEEFKDSSE